MSNLNECLITTCQTSLQWSACLWNYNTGNVLQIYKNGGTAVSKTLSMVGNDYIMYAEQNKPLLHVWPVNSQEQVKNIRFILPEPAKAIAICPNSQYLAVGLGLKLYIWHLASGKLLTVQQKHFQPITCIKFANTNEYLVVGGQDGILVVYNFGDLVCLQTNYLPQTEMGQIEPMYTKMDHSLPINDIHIGTFGPRSRIATVSSDNTCRIYDLLNGDLLLNLVFQESIISVIFDSACWNLYAGTTSGVINHFYLRNPPRTLEHHIDPKENNKNRFVGHKKKVTCLALNISDEYLASGSDDCKVLIWEVKSQQIVRTIEHKEAITNIKFVLGHENFFAYHFTPLHCLKSLERNLNLDSQNYVVSVIQNEDIVFENVQTNKCTDNEVLKLQGEIAEVKTINKQLYLQIKSLLDKKYNM